MRRIFAICPESRPAQKRALAERRGPMGGGSDRAERLFTRNFHSLASSKMGDLRRRVPSHSADQSWTRDWKAWERLIDKRSEIGACRNERSKINDCTLACGESAHPEHPYTFIWVVRKGRPPAG